MTSVELWVGREHGMTSVELWVGIVFWVLVLIWGMTGKAGD